MCRISVFISLLSMCLSFQTAFTQSSQLTNELIWYSGEFSSDGVSGVNSMRDGLHFTSMESNESGGTSVVMYEYATGDMVEILADSKDIFGDSSTAFDGYSFSSDETKMLIQTETTPIYRHSFEANYYVFDRKDKRSYPMAKFDSGKQRLAAFSPDGSMIAFVRHNNIIIHEIAEREETSITYDGKLNSIINGFPDWVYEEEFGFHKGFYWSPKSDRIAYYKFDETNVKEFQMAMYGELYPEQYKYKYPKAGEDNSKVSIHIYDLNAVVSKRVDIGSNTNIYIPRILWTKNNDKLCVMRMNRHQNHLEFLLTDLSKSQPFELTTTKIFEEQNDTYIDISDNLTFLAAGKSFIWNSERDGFDHLYLFDMQGEVIRQLTEGQWDVVEFLGINEKSKTFYYTSRQESILEQHVYSKGLKKQDARKLSQIKGQNDAVFSDSFEYFINYHSDANTPPYISLHNSKGREIRTLKDNAQLKKTVGKYGFAEKQFFTFTNSSGTELNCWMIKPADFDAGKKYPVYMAIYGGPGVNTVKDSWGGRNLYWHQMLAQKGYIVVSCDPRGTPYRGKEFKHSTYMELGKLETEDFIDFAKYLSAQSYVDGSRIGIQGWSYGGYMTALCMTKGAEHFKAGISVAPVTNWRYYDSIYTERFMRTPEENASGYDDNSPINHVELLNGPFLLIHGSADDNVHYQNTMEMIDALVQANKAFDLFVYPNKNHGIYGGTTRLHLFNKMTEFVLRNL